MSHFFIFLQCPISPQSLPDMSKIRFSLVGIDTWFIRDRDLGRVWDWDWDLGSEISEKSPEISENIARDRDFPYIISEKLPRFGRDWYFSCIAAWISTRWLYFYRENSGKNGRDLGFRGHDVIYSGPRWTCLFLYFIQYSTTIINVHWQTSDPHCDSCWE